jgi:hypothetical protein
LIDADGNFIVDAEGNYVCSIGPAVALPSTPTGGDFASADFTSDDFVVL